MPIDKYGRPTHNEDDTYIKGRYKTEVYRYNNDTLAVQFITTTSAKITIIKLTKLGIELKKFGQGDYESVYFISENDIDKVNSILKFQTKGAKISPKSKRTVRKLIKTK
jgi:hypothetical protein